MSRGSSTVLLILLGLIAISVMGGGAFFIANTVSKNIVTNVSQSQPTPSSPTPTVSVAAEVTNYPGTKEYVSQKLGIAFNYLPKFGEEDVVVKEVGNKVYIGSSTMKVEDGQFVEVFSKDPQDSLAEAVKEKFLAGKSEKDCFVVPSPGTYENYPASYQAVEISFPKPTDSEQPWFALSEKCSVEYAQTNGIRYFLGDSKHPGKLLFFGIGQYGILAGTSLTWQDTIRFLD